MKKTIAFILAALILTNFAACGSRTGDETSGSRSDRSTVSAALSSGPEVTAGTAPSTTESTPPATDVTGPVTPPTSVPPTSEPVRYLPVEGREDLLEFDLGAEFSESSIVHSGAIFGDRLLVTACTYLTDEDFEDEFGDPIWEMEWTIYLIDLTTGSVRGSYQADGDLSDSGFLSDGSVYVMTFSEDPDLFGYDLFRFSDFPGGMQSVTGIDWDSYCGLGEDGTLWLLDAEAGILRATAPFDNRPDAEYPCSGWSTVRYHSTHNGTAFFWRYGNLGASSFAGIKLSDGSETVYPHLRNADFGYRDMLVLDSSDEWLIAFPTDPDRVNAFPKRSPGSYIGTAAGSRFAEYDYDFDFGDEELFGAYGVYDGASGEMLGQITEAREMPGLSAICMNDRGSLILACYGEGENLRLLRWQYDAGEPTPAESFRVIDVRGQDEECRRIVDEIYETYRIRVYFDELSLVDLVWDYTCEYVEDSYTIRIALEELSAALAKYPAGMFDEMLTEYYGAMEVYLCGNFVPTDGTGISNAVALTNTRGGAFIIAFNIYYQGMMEQNLSHELMHVMEHRLTDYCTEAGIDYQSEWAALNPKGFSYYNSYHDKKGNEISDTANTTWDNYASAWFVDPYSKSFATEDRARVFEYLFIGSEWTFQSPHLQAKAEYLCALIRAAFPSVGQMERASWELFSS